MPSCNVCRRIFVWTTMSAHAVDCCAMDACIGGAAVIISLIFDCNCMSLPCEIIYGSNWWPKFPIMCSLVIRIHCAIHREQFYRSHSLNRTEKKATRKESNNEINRQFITKVEQSSNDHLRHSTDSWLSLNLVENQFKYSRISPSMYLYTIFRRMLLMRIHVETCGLKSHHCGIH